MGGLPMATTIRSPNMKQRKIDKEIDKEREREREPYTRNNSTRFNQQRASAGRLGGCGAMERWERQPLLLGGIALSLSGRVLSGVPGGPHPRVSGFLQSTNAPIAPGSLSFAAAAAPPRRPDLPRAGWPPAPRCPRAMPGEGRVVGEMGRRGKEVDRDGGNGSSPSTVVTTVI